MTSTNDTAHRPWNLGRPVGPEPPSEPEHIWVIRTRLQHEGRIRDLALVNTAIDSKLRGCDRIRPRPPRRRRPPADHHRPAEDRPARTLELTETTRETLAAWLKLRSGDGLFPSRSRPRRAPHDAPVRPARR